MQHPKEWRSMPDTNNKQVWICCHKSHQKLDFRLTRSKIKIRTFSLQLYFCNVSSRVVVRSYSPIVLQGMRLHYYVSSTIPTKSRRQQCSKTSSREQQVSSTRHVRDSPTLPGHTVLLSVWWLHIFHKVTARSSLFFLYRVGYSSTAEPHIQWCYAFFASFWHFQIQLI